MKTTWLLAWTIFRGNSFASFAGDASTGKSRWRNFGSIVLFVFLAIYFAAVSSGSAFGLYELLEPVGLQSLIIGLYTSAGVMVVFFFGALYVLSIFYFASDVDKLLPLPLLPEHVIGAKFMVASVYEYIFVAGVLLPPLTVYGFRSGAAWTYYLFMILVFGLLPIIPLTMASVLTMLIMRFTPLTRNKDRFKAIAGIVVLALSLMFSYTISTLSSRKANDLAAMLSNRTNQLSQLTASVFPGTSLAVDALASTDPRHAMVQIILLAAFSVVALLVMLAAGRLLYFKGVIGLSSASSRHKALSGEALRVESGASGKRSSAFSTYALKDLRVLFRTPIFMINNVLMNFLWPIFLVLPVVGAGGQDEDLVQIQNMVNNLTDGSDPASSSILLAIVFGMAIFVNGTNGIAESALSREGSQFYIMKILPMSYTRQIAAKLAVALALGLAGIVLSFSLAFAFLRLPLWFIGLSILTFPGALLLPNLTGIIFELYWPKLHWDNEQKAVKQNMNVLYGILFSVLLAGLVIAPIVAFKLSLHVAALLLIIVPLVMSGILLLILRRMIPQRMRAISP